MNIASDIYDIFRIVLRHPESVINILAREPTKPYYIIRYGLQHGKELYYLTKLASFLQYKKQKILEYFEEIDREFLDHIVFQTKMVTSKSYQEWRDIWARYIYVVIRVLQPSIVVETGVAAGISSAYILKALHENGKGVLYSIDLPTPLQPIKDAWIPHGREIGYAIPQNLKKHWKLILGDSKKRLPELLNTLGSVDVFLHDSLHTYEHMIFEYRTVYKLLKRGGVILSDDVNLNKAFSNFCKQYNIKYIVIGNRLGITRKL